MENRFTTIDGQLYVHYSYLKNWEKNNQARYITNENWQKLLDELTLNGVSNTLTIDDEGVVYDGNHRLKAVKCLIEERGVLTAQNGSDLALLPVLIKHPQTEADKWRLALVGNEQFTSWNRDELLNFFPEFETDLDLSSINISFFDPEGIGEELHLDEALPETLDPKPAAPKSATCPECGAVFTLDKK